MMATRSNKVRFLHFPRGHCYRITLLMVMRSHRDLDCMDGAEWDGYGVELSRTGGLRGDLVNFEHTHTHTHIHTGSEWVCDTD